MCGGSTPLRHHVLKIRNFANKGRGVVVQKEVKQGEVIERCPVIVVPKEQVDLIDQTELYNYYYSWGLEGDAAIALGHGSLYNHSENPNVEPVRDFDKKEIIMRAKRQIKKGEELTIHYGPLWFNAK